MPNMQGNDEVLYGAPTIAAGNPGGAVNPMIARARGGTVSPNATPFSQAPNMAQGGAIPDDDSDDSDYSDGGSPSDQTTDAVSKALQTVNSVLLYGRQKNGLTKGDQSNDNSQQQKSSDDNSDNSDQSDDGSSSDSEGALSFDEGGAVPDDGEDNSGQPAIPDGGAAPALPQGDDNSIGTPDAGEGDDNSIAQEPSAVKRFMNYLTGGDAMSPQEFAKYQKQTGGDNLLAVQAAMDAGGPEAAFGAVQYLRQVYDHSMGHARAATNGTDSKPPDMAAAANSATQAMQALPDGNDVSFKPGMGGVTATVNGKTMQLTPQQLDRLTDVGDVKGGGQFDAMLEKGAPAVIQKILAAPRGQVTFGAPGSGFGAPPSAGALTSGGDDEDDESGSAARPDKQPYDPVNNPFGGSKFGPPTTANPYETTISAQPYRDWLKQNPGYAAHLKEQGLPQGPDPAAVRARLAGINSGVTAGKDAGRDRIAEIQERNKGALAVQGLRNQAREGSNSNAMQIARMRLDSQTQLATQRASQAALRMEQQGRTDAERENGRRAGREINAAVLSGTATPQTIDAINQKWGLTATPTYTPQGTPPAAAPRQQAPQQPQQSAPAQRPANVPQGAKYYQGNWYTRGPKGEAVRVQ